MEEDRGVEELAPISATQMIISDTCKPYLAHHYSFISVDQKEGSGMVHGSEKESSLPLTVQILSYKHNYPFVDGTLVHLKYTVNRIPCTIAFLLIARSWEMH